MKNAFQHRSRAALAAPALLALAAGTASVCHTASAEDVLRLNGSVDVAAGQHLGTITTVNGSVNIGADAAVGSTKTVNGAVHLGPGATAASLTTVNGAMHADERSHVTGDVTAVNGGLYLAGGVTVDGNLSDVNGGVRVNGAHIAGRIKTTAGDISIGPGSHVDGGILVERSRSYDMSRHVPTIIIGPGAVVGPMRFEHEVQLYVSEHATIGSIEGATPQRFSGDAPPR